MEMRRKDRRLSPREVWRVLEKSEFCTLSMTDGEGRPYGVPVSFALVGETLYFHCAPEGRKLDCLRARPRVWLSAVESQRTLPAALSVAYRSAMASGRAALVEDPAERRLGLEALCKKYAPGEPSALPSAAACQAALVWRVEIEEISGKENPGD